MKPLYTYRPFIHRDRTDIDAYLEESQFWTDLYDLFISIKDNGYKLKVPSIQMFNEVHYQCVRLMLDRHPEEDVWGNYLNPVKDSLGWRYASDLCFSLVYAVLSTVKNPPAQIPRFLNVLRERKLKTDEWYFPHCEAFLSYARGINYDIDLAPCPEKPGHLDNFSYDARWWKEVTNNFDQERIRQIVGLWQTQKEQLEIIDIIKRKFKQEESNPTYTEDDLPF